MACSFYDMKFNDMQFYDMEFDDMVVKTWLSNMVNSLDADKYNAYHL